MALTLLIIFVQKIFGESALGRIVEMPTIAILEGSTLLCFFIGNFIFLISSLPC